MIYVVFASADNKRSFWRFVKDQRKSKCPPAFLTTEKLIHKPEHICQAFNVFFTSVHTLPGTYSESPPPCSLPIPELPPITINLSWLTKALLALNPHKAPRPRCYFSKSTSSNSIITCSTIVASYEFLT